jgi:hypothetical protein
MKSFESRGNPSRLVLLTGTTAVPGSCFSMAAVVLLAGKVTNLKHGSLGRTKGPSEIHYNSHDEFLLDLRNR